MYNGEESVFLLIKSTCVDCQSKFIDTSDGNKIKISFPRAGSDFFFSRNDIYKKEVKFHTMD